jgi:hypothetical protein
VWFSKLLHTLACGYQHFAGTFCLCLQVFYPEGESTRLFVAEYRKFCKSVLNGRESDENIAQLTFLTIKTQCYETNTRHQTWVDPST